MKQKLLIFLSLCSLWTHTSCEDKLPGSKPEIFFGKWQTTGNIYTGFMGPSFVIGTYWETFEFTKKGGSFTRLEYITDENKYRDPYVEKLANWSYDGKELHFRDKDGGLWGQPVYRITPDTLLLGSVHSYITYIRISD